MTRFTFLSRNWQDAQIIRTAGCHNFDERCAFSQSSNRQGDVLQLFLETLPPGESVLDDHSRLFVMIETCAVYSKAHFTLYGVCWSVDEDLF